MVLYYTIVSFVFGAVLGSFYNVVGYRLPRNESLIKPSSHCPKCNHKLGALELVPIFSYLLQRGKCKNCGCKISSFYMIFEFLTGMLFAISYLVFGFSIEFYISLIFVSMAIIIIISDYQTMIIPDEVLITSIILILIGLFIKGNFNLVLESLLNGLIAFIIMYLIKLLGDFIFKKESMGGGDIKLLFVIGLVIGYELAITSIFLASFIALPVAIVYSIKSNHKKYIDDDEIPEHSIPFGPFLCIAALIIFFSQVNFNDLLNILLK